MKLKLKIDRFHSTLMTHAKSITYRFASKNEHEKIYDFAMRALAETDLPKFAEDAGEGMEERMSNLDEGYVLLAEDKDLEDGIVGYIEIDPAKSTQMFEVYIRGIFVLQDYRRIGVGRKLVKGIILRHGGGGKRLRVQAFAREGIRFWESYGFKIQSYDLQYTGKSK